LRRFGRRISKIEICVVFAVGVAVADAEEVFTDFTLEVFASGVPLLGVMQITIVSKVVCVVAVDDFGINGLNDVGVLDMMVEDGVVVVVSALDYSWWILWHVGGL
jgi:hypothetical protein